MKYNVDNIDNYLLVRLDTDFESHKPLSLHLESYSQWVVGNISH